MEKKERIVELKEQIRIIAEDLIKKCVELGKLSVKEQGELPVDFSEWIKTNMNVGQNIEQKGSH